MRVPAVSVAILVLGVVICAPWTQAQEEEIDATAGTRKAYIDHLRANFDDIHDVSMRFHMTDPSIGGLIGLRMTWAGGRLQDAEVLVNETGSEAEALAMIEAIRGWTIPELVESVTFNSALRIRLVGSDHADFEDCGILTGSVKDAEGRPVGAAVVELTPADGGESEPLRARTNREGIFIRTVIPPGVWSVVCNVDGVGEARIDGLELAARQHEIRHLVLKP